MAEIQHPQPSANEETRAYWEGATRGELVLQRCRACGRVQHRPRALCVSCLSDAIEHFVASGRGRVYTFTVTHQNGARGFREALPYVLAYVELDEGPRVGLCAHYRERGAVAGVAIVETLSGGSREGEQDDALRLAKDFGYAGVGGSDAHIVSHIARCVTRFPGDVRDDKDLVEALRAGEFEAISWK